MSSLQLRNDMNPSVVRNHTLVASDNDAVTTDSSATLRGIAHRLRLSCVS